MGGTGTRQLLSREERQASILRAAATAFARTGYRATSMDDVAAEVGVTRLIVYRHFSSKEALYRAVLDRVRTKVRDMLQGALADPTRDGFPIRPLLRVAREDPDGFRLLIVHAAREPQFAAYVHEARAQAIADADRLVGTVVHDPTLRSWVTRTTLAYCQEAVLAWLEVGDPDRDEEFVAQARDGLVAMISAWIE